MSRIGIFRIDRQDEMIVFTPESGLDAPEDLELAEDEVVDLLRDKSIKNCVINFPKVEAIEPAKFPLFIKLWGIVAKRQGCLVFCNFKHAV